MASKYYTDTQNAVDILTDSVGVLCAKKNALSDDDQEFGSDNIYDVITQTDVALRQVKLLNSVHELMGTTKELMDAQFTAIEQGNRTGAYRVVNYQKADFETPRLLETKFGVPAQTILDFNHLTMDEFDEATTVQIPIPYNVAVENGVFITGDQSANNALGTDIATDATFDPDTEDLAVLSPEDSLAQTINNILTSEYGDIPFYENVGLPGRAGSDLTDDVLLPLIQQDIATALDDDSQLLNVTDVTVTKKGNAVTAVVTMEVNGSTVTQNIPIGGGT